MRSHGKSTLARNLVKLFGITSPSISADSSMFGINKLCSMYSGIPLWFDDIRDIGEQGIWNKIILASYENSNIVKGTKELKLSDKIEYNAALLITSEFFMKSTASGTRCIKLIANEYDQDRSNYKELKALIDEYFPYIGMHTLRFVQRNKEKCIEKLEEMERLMLSLGYKDRMSKNYAVVLTGILLLADLDERNFGDLWGEILELSKKETTEIKIDEFENGYAVRLLADIANMMFNDSFKAEYKYGKEWIFEDKQLIFFTENLYNLWIKYANNNRQDSLMTRQEFTVQLRRLPFSIKPNSAYSKRWEGKMRRGLFLDVEKMGNFDNDSIKQMLEVFKDVAREEQVAIEQEQELA